MFVWRLRNFPPRKRLFRGILCLCMRLLVIITALSFDYLLRQDIEDGIPVVTLKATVSM